MLWKFQNENNISMSRKKVEKWLWIFSKSAFPCVFFLKILLTFDVKSQKVDKKYLNIKKYYELLGHEATA